MRLICRRDAKDRAQRRFALTDVTEGKQAEETPKESEIRLRYLADHLLTVQKMNVSAWHLYCTTR